MIRDQLTNFDHINMSKNVTGSSSENRFTSWLLGSPNSSIGGRFAYPLSSDTSTEVQQPQPRQRSKSFSESLGLHKIPNPDHESVIRGDFGTN